MPNILSPSKSAEGLSVGFLFAFSSTAADPVALVPLIALMLPAFFLQVLERQAKM